MSFGELLERYKNGTATAGERAEVEQALERHEAIEAYLADQMDEAFTQPPLPEGEDSAGVRRVRRRVRLRIWGSVLVVMAVLLAVVLALNPLLDKIYYDPNAGMAARYDNDGQFYLDTVTLTELHYPGYTVMGASATPRGFGVYDISINQQDYLKKDFDTVTGQLVRGRPSAGLGAFAKVPIGNALADRMGTMIYVEDDGSETTEQPQESIDDYVEEISKLPESAVVSIYFSFRKDIPLEEVAELQAKYPDSYFSYVAVRTNDDPMGNLMTGFAPGMGGFVLDDDLLPKEYPMLRHQSAYEELAEQDAAAAWQAHFLDMLRYISGRPDFLRAFGPQNYAEDVRSNELYKEMLAFVEDKGTNSYGVLMNGPPADMLAFQQEAAVGGLYVDYVRLSSL